jgi:hypothetical protein
MIVRSAANGKANDGARGGPRGSRERAYGGDQQNELERRPPRYYIRSAHAEHDRSKPCRV